MNRKEITAFLNGLVEWEWSKTGSYLAKEVSVDYGTSKAKRIDYVSYKPLNTISQSGLEKGDFTCIEVKSCMEDLFSGSGLNFIGDVNFLVTTAELYKQINGKWDTQRKLEEHIRKINPEAKYRIGYDWGIYVAKPWNRDWLDEYEKPTPLDDPEYKDFPGHLGWSLHKALPCQNTRNRQRSVTEMLYFMMKATVYGRGVCANGSSYIEMKLDI